MTIPAVSFLKMGCRSAGAVAAIAVLTYICSQLIAVNPATVGFLYLITVLLIATKWGLVDAVLASVVATLCYNYFFLPPIGNFTIAEPSNWIALVTFLVTSLVASQLSERAKRRTIEVINRQLEMERLYALSRAILLSDTSQPMGRQIAREIARIYELPAVILYDRNSGEIHRGGPDGTVDLHQELRDAAICGTLFRDDKTQTIVSAVNFGSKPVASIALRGTALSDMALQALSNLVSLGLEKARNQEATNRAQAAQQSEEFKSTLLDALAHEFNTPLTSIRAATSAMLTSDTLTSEDRHEMIEVIDQEATRLGTLVHEALHLARIEAGRMQLNKKPTAIHTLIESALKQVEPALEGRAVEASVQPDLKMVLVDMELMQLVLRHLLDNAIKYSTSGSPITVTARLAGEFAVIGIRNMGEEIPEWERSRIFDKYYRSSQVRQRVPGTGMGLSIARQIVLAHGGDIWLESIQGEGTEFFVSVPLAKKESPA
jgi:two-component system sensor histidine kinase KdpD